MEEKVGYDAKTGNRNYVAPGAGNPCGYANGSCGTHAQDGTGGLLVIKCANFQSSRSNYF